MLFIADAVAAAARISADTKRRSAISERRCCRTLQGGHDRCAHEAPASRQHLVDISTHQHQHTSVRPSILPSRWVALLSASGQVPARLVGRTSYCGDDDPTTDKIALRIKPAARVDRRSF